MSRERHTESVHVVTGVGRRTLLQKVVLEGQTGIGRKKGGEEGRSKQRTVSRLPIFLSQTQTSNSSLGMFSNGVSLKQGIFKEHIKFYF